MEKFKSNCDKCPEKGKIYELIKNKPVTEPSDVARLRQMAKLQGIPQDQVDAKLAGEGGTLKLCASDSYSCDIMSFKTDADLKAKMLELALVPVNTTNENRIKKSELIKIIKEEIKAVIAEEPATTCGPSSNSCSVKITNKSNYQFYADLVKELEEELALAKQGKGPAGEDKKQMEYLLRELDMYRKKLAAEIKKKKKD